MKSPKKALTVLSVYSKHISRYPLLFSGTVVGVIIMQITYLVGPLYMRQFFNLLTGQPTVEITAQIIGVLAIIVLIWVIEWAVHRAQYFCIIYLEAKVMSDLYNTGFEYLLGHSYNFFSSRFAGSLTHRVSKFAKSYETLYDATINSFFPTLLFILGAVSILYIRNHILGLILAGWAFAFVVFQVYVSYSRRFTRSERAKADSRVTGNLADAISNQSTISLFSGTAHETRLFGETISHWREATIRTWSVDAWIWLGIGLFMIAAQTGILYVGILLWQKGLFTIGDFVLVQAYLLTTFGKLESLNRELRRTGDAYSDAGEMVDILNTAHEVHDIPDAKKLSVQEGAITFEKVQFHFQEERGIFKDFDLEIRGGEKVAFVGPSGAGKSTITKLILRLFDVASGQIHIDGQDISKVTQESLRNAISFVPQEPILFHRTLLENIRYGRRDATDAEVYEAARQAHCDEFISHLPHKYETYVGERGIKLSGGERQRVAIARAILKNAPILMLDEATSSLDSASEVLIQDALEKLMRGKTVLVIAHRLSTIAKMDRIIVLDEGRVAQEGTHTELLEKGGTYSELWNHQAGGFLQD